VLVSLYLEHAPCSLDLEGCLIAHSFNGSPKILNLQQVANQHECQHFPLPEVILQLPEILQNEVHVQGALEFGQLEHVVIGQHADLVREVPAVLQIVAEPSGPIVLHVK